MAPFPGEFEYEDERQRARDQVELILNANPEGVVTDAEDPADHRYLFAPGVVLVDEADVNDVNDVILNSSDIPADSLGDIVSNVSGELNVRSLLSGGTDFASVRQFLHALDVIDEALGEGVVTPDHYLHVSGTGAGRPCPATEPEETGLTGPWPEETRRTDANPDIQVTVTVVDTGWWEGATAHSWLHDVEAEESQRQTFAGDPRLPALPEYGGHGTFIAGVARCRAPRCKIEHQRFVVEGGAVRESDMVSRLERAIAATPEPHVINLSAGGHTRNGLRLKSFRRLWNEQLKHLSDTVLIAAAGNDGTDDPFYPAAFTWAVGVGSLDRNGDISSFSNYAKSADIYVVGRNHVNAFPVGTYECRETPDKGDQRIFTTGLARWSGTSFAAPLFAGLVAAERNVDNSRSVREIAWDLVQGIQEEDLPPYGKVRRMKLDGTGAYP